jgi:hypothetical protein
MRVRPGVSRGYVVFGRMPVACVMISISSYLLVPAQHSGTDFYAKALKYLYDGSFGWFSLHDGDL